MEDYENVNIHFLVRAAHKNGNESSDDMLLCFKWCDENTTNTKWVKEEDCLDLSPGKRDIFVFEEFEGDAFVHLKKFKSVIVGPRALLSCISDGKPMPKVGSTIFTTAMRDCFVSCTSVDDHEKAKMQEKVTYMGGIFEPRRLFTFTTHLVAGDVRSNKYKQAVDAKISIMSSQWVDAVWEESLKRNVHALDKEFERFKCPAFLGLTVTSSNISRKSKEKIKKLIEENGGVFQGALVGGVTNMLVVKGMQGDKYCFAKKCGLPCVEEEWVYESARLGHSVDTKPYEVGSRGNSTPVNDDKPDFLADMSTMSAISYANETLVKHGVVNETVNRGEVSTASKTSSVQTPAAPVKPSAQLLDSLNKLDLKAVKAAGHFLDGCKVFLSGFEADSGEKLRRVLNAGGATRFNEISDSVSHIIVGNTSLDEIDQMLQSCVHRPLVVTLAWVLESIKIRGRAPESKFLVAASVAKLANPEPPSPSLKKSLAMLRTPVIPPLVLESAPLTDDTESATGKLIPQYLGNAEKAASTDGTLFKVPSRCPEEPPVSVPDETAGEEETQTEDFFEGLKFLLVGYDDEDTQLWTETIEGFGGTVVAESYRGVPDYGIVPFCGAVVRHATKEVVTDLWLESCSQSNAKVPVAYYHLPVAAPTVKPLTGLVLGFSSYILKERDYLVLLSQVLGAVSQDVFARKDNAAKKVLASTHLVCSGPGSTKFSAAMKWGIPAVSHKWLLACLRERKVADIDQYAVTQATTLSPTVLQPVPSLTSEEGTDVSKNTPMDRSVDATYMPNTTTTPLPSTRPNTTLVNSAKSNTTPASSTKSNNTSVQSAKSITTPASSTKLNVTPLNISNLSTTASVGKDITPRTSADAVPQNYGFSQETPIRFPRLAGQETTRVSAAGYVGTPEMATPETPYFGCIGKFSPNTRKGIKRWVENGPDLQRKESPERQSKKRKSTPVNVLLKRCWDKWSNVLAEDAEATLAANENVQPDSTQPEVSEGNRNVAREGAGAYTQLNQLDQLLKASTSSGGVSADDATKLQRRSSLMEAAATTAAITTRAAPDHTAVETGVKESQWSQSNDVGWAFHDHRVNSREASPKSLDSSSSKPAANNGKTKSAHDGPFKVILSTMTAQDREKYKQIVLTLGGMVSESTYFDLSATHLICMKPARSEKMLACIASGKWVLHSSYLDESCEAGFFLEEDKYEYGNPLAASNIPTLKSGSIEERLALACYRWRARLAANTSEKGAYHGMAAIICTSPDKMDSFKRLVLAGGGTVVESRPPFANRSSATHLFIDGIKAKLVVDYQTLVNNGVLCLPLLFLNNFLVDFPMPRAEDNVLPEAASLKVQVPRHSSRLKK